MKKISHSEISTYLDCQKKWDLIYNKKITIDNDNFKFGSMGHKVLETGIVPDEGLYPELKEAFNITSWNRYFNLIFNDLDRYFKDYNVIYREYPIETDLLKGVIDLVLKHKETGKYLICDYKFSFSNKDVEDLYLDEQLYIYASVFGSENNICLDDIEICYINIPKKCLETPKVLKTGKLSKDKSQYVSYEEYKSKIEELGLNESDYEDFLEELKDKRFVTYCKNTINYDMLERIANNIDNVVKDMDKGYILEKCTYMCKQCPYVKFCKYDKVV